MMKMSTLRNLKYKVLYTTIKYTGFGYINRKFIAAMCCCNVLKPFIA